MHRLTAQTCNCRKHHYADAKEKNNLCFLPGSLHIRIPVLLLLMNIAIKALFVIRRNICLFLNSYAESAARNLNNWSGNRPRPTNSPARNAIVPTWKKKYPVLHRFRTAVAAVYRTALPAAAEAYNSSAVGRTGQRPLFL